MHSSPPTFRFWFALALVTALFLTGCGSGFRTYPPGTVLLTSPVSVSVYPYTTEDLSGPCVYDLHLPASAAAITGVFVIFERGDTADFYADGTVRAAVDALGLATVFAHECDAQTTGDFQADASKGPSRVLVTALSALSMSSGHPELGTAGVVLFGYSAAGVLTATMLNELPDRIFGAVEYIAGDAHVNIAQVAVGAGASQIPALILANGDDEKSGTTRILTYYATGHTLAAPWALGVQHATDHCCSLSTRPLVLPWLAAIAASKGAAPLGAASLSAPIYTTFTCTPNGTVDVFGNTNCDFMAAALQTISTPADGWLPDATSGAAWRTWVLNPVTNQ